MQDLKMGGTEGFGIELEVAKRLRGEEGMERHIFGHSRETGEKSKAYFITDFPPDKSLLHH